MITACQSALITPRSVSSTVPPQNSLHSITPVPQTVQTGQPSKTAFAAALSTNPPQAAVTQTQTHTPVPSGEYTPVIEYSAPQRVSCSLDGCSYRAVQPFEYPIPADFSPYVEKTYRYGSTQSGTRESHSGVEIAAELGTPVIAVAYGTVYYAGDDQTQQFGRYKDFYGNLIILEHRLPGLDQPIYTLYAHLSKIIVQTGDSVESGEQIGNVGNSGATSGVHLHFEVRRGTAQLTGTVNPELWLAPREVKPDSTKNTLLTTGTLVVRLKNGGEAVFSQAVKIEAYDEIENKKTSFIDAESYAFSVPLDSDWDENLVVSGLLPGTYRISVVFDNRMYEKWINISSELITLVEFDFAA